MRYVRSFGGALVVAAAACGQIVSLGDPAETISTTVDDAGLLAVECSEPPGAPTEFASSVAFDTAITGAWQSCSDAGRGIAFFEGQTYAVGAAPDGGAFEPTGEPSAFTATTSAIASTAYILNFAGDGSFTSYIGYSFASPRRLRLVEGSTGAITDYVPVASAPAADVAVTADAEVAGDDGPLAGDDDDVEDAGEDGGVVSFDAGPDARAAADARADGGADADAAD